MIYQFSLKSSKEDENSSGHEDGDPPPHDHERDADALHRERSLQRGTKPTGLARPAALPAGKSPRRKAARR